MKIIKCPICGKPRNDETFTECPYCGWGYVGWESVYNPDEKEDYNLMSQNQAKAMVKAGKTIFGKKLPHKPYSKKPKIILHIPHSSTYIPQDFWKNSFSISRRQIEDFNLKMTDLYSDELFGTNSFCKNIFRISRIVCDVERYIDDDKEEMNKFGMGIVYTHTNDGIQYFLPDEIYRQKIIEEIYKPYHKKLNNTVDYLMQVNNFVVMIDCHSFSENIIMQKERKCNLPDICLGTVNSTDARLTDYIKNYFENCGYTVAINYPYSGSIIPDVVQDVNNGNFQSVMIEVNRKIYLTEDRRKNNNFYELQSQLNTLFSEVEINYEKKTKSRNNERKPRS